MSENICSQFAQLLETLREKKSTFDIAVEELKKYEDKPKIDEGKYKSYKAARDDLEKSILEIDNMLLADKRLWDWKVGERQVFDKEVFEKNKRMPVDVVFRSDGERFSAVVDATDKEYAREIDEDKLSLNPQNFGRNADVVCIEKDDRRGLKFHHKVENLFYPKKGRDVFYYLDFNDGSKRVLMKNGKRFGDNYGAVSYIETSADGKTVVGAENEYVLETLSKDPAKDYTKIVVNDSYLETGNSCSGKVNIDEAGKKVIFSTQTEYAVIHDLETGEETVKPQILNEQNYYEITQLALSSGGENYAMVASKQLPQGSQVDDIHYQDDIMFNDILTHCELDETGKIVFSPDGKRVAFCGEKEGYWGIYIVDEDGLANDERFRGYRVLGRISDPVWSDDGEHIAYISNVDEGTDMMKGVYVDGQRNQKFFDFEKISNLSFSPDGEKVMFIGKKDGNYFRIVEKLSTWHGEG